jgi:hypothetical protein
MITTRKTLNRQLDQKASMKKEMKMEDMIFKGKRLSQSV